MLLICHPVNVIASSQSPLRRSTKRRFDPGEAKFSISEAARVMGVSRAYVYRCMLFASIPQDEFEAVLDLVGEKGLTSETAIADEIKRRTGKARVYTESCPHCGGELRRRVR
ncbi:hypothetical protein NKI36_06460 [Mesorhizobium caraganae]|uniref:Helix-turn-helix domain-containing protein n=1 Tax=Mesorhizobium caraganae TaxID=483206 RepID=A0ABV1YVB8_9HYPH